MMPPQVYAVVALLLFGAGFGTGWKLQGWKLEREIAQLKLDYAEAVTKQNQAVKVIETMRGAISVEVGKRLAAENRKQDTVTEYVTNEVIKYVQSPNANTCKFGDDWVRVYDTAASGELPQTAGAASGITDTAGTVGDVEVLRLTTINYAKYHEVANRLKGWQDWYRQQQKTEPSK